MWKTSYGDLKFISIHCLRDGGYPDEWCKDEGFYCVEIYRSVVSVKQCKEINFWRSLQSQNTAFFFKSYESLLRILKMVTASIKNGSVWCEASVQKMCVYLKLSNC